MKIGFTGTRHGMTWLQYGALQVVLAGIRNAWAETSRVDENLEFHHGDCLGADMEAVLAVDGRGWWVVSHPPVDATYRAYARSHEIRAARPYLDRDDDIVVECDELLATPRKMTEERRGGTWYTIRKARELDKPRTIIWPDGNYTREGERWTGSR